MTDLRFEFASRLPPEELRRRFVHLAAARLNTGVADPFDPVNAPFTVREQRDGVLVCAARPVHQLSRYVYRGVVSARAAGGSQLRFRRERVIRMAALSPQWKIGISAQLAVLGWAFWNYDVPMSQVLSALGLLAVFLFGVMFVATAAFQDGLPTADVEAAKLEAALRAVASECDPISSGAT